MAMKIPPAPSPGRISAIVAATAILCRPPPSAAFVFPSRSTSTPKTYSNGNGAARRTPLCMGVDTSRQLQDLLGGAASHLPHLGGTHPPPGPREKVLLGNVKSSLRKIVFQTKPAVARLLDVIDPLELAVILAVAFGTEPFLRAYNNKILNGVFRRKNPKNFEQSKLCYVGRILCQVGQCAFGAYLGEVLIAFLDALGLHLPSSAPRAVAITIYAIWAAEKASRLKKRLLERLFDRLPRKKRLPSTGVFYDRLLDIAIYLLMAIVVLDLCRVKVGVVIKSFLSVAGLSSLILGLSLRDPATQIFQGTSLLLLDRFSPGDKIRLADGTVGKVMNIGWLDTTLMGPDNISVRIPNSEIASKRVYNISRMKRSQVKQNLRFRYVDIDVIPQLMEDIKEEIKASCPKLITNGSRPFRAHWRKYNDDHISVVVDTHFDIPPSGQHFYDNQEEVLLAIARAVKKNNVQFALPSRVSLMQPPETK